MKSKFLRKLSLASVLAGSIMFSSAALSAPLEIIATGFPQYDLVKHIVGDKGSVRMLLKIGAEAHSFEPTPKDLIDIGKASLFVYNGGENDEWIEDFLKSSDVKPKTFVFTHEVALREEESVEGMQEHDHEHHHHEEKTLDEHDHEHEADEHEHEHEHDADEHEHEMDEHVWTSPKNDVTLLNSLLKTIVALDPDNRDYYSQNAAKYIESFEALDAEFKELVSKAPHKTLIFGDRFPLLYFVKDYGLDYYAAFRGCSNETEVDATTIKFLIDKAGELKSKVIFKIELTNSSIADTIAEANDAKVLTFQSGHNLTNDEFEAGKSLYDLFKENLKVLHEALY